MRNEVVPICDLHCDTVLDLHGGSSLASNPEGHVDIPRLRRAGVGLQVFACFVPSGLTPDRAFAQANALLDALEAACAANAADVQLVRSPAEADAAVAGGRIAIMAAIENGHAIRSDLSNLARFHARGVRYLTLTHAVHLDWAASSGGEWTAERGLTSFGEEVVREMNRLGMIVDVSHVHERTFWDVVRVAARPVIASHSCAAALCPFARNLTDDQIRAIAATGGMVGVNFYPGFLDPDYLAALGIGGPDPGRSLPELFRMLDEAEVRSVDDPRQGRAAARVLAAQLRERAGEAKAGVETIVDHLEHMLRLVGDDHVGFGSDFDGVPQLPQEVADCTALPRILERLAARGVGDRTLRKVAWENFLRVWRENV